MKIIRVIRMTKKKLRCYLIEGKEFCDSPLLELPGYPNCTNCLLSHLLQEIRELNQNLEFIRRVVEDPPESS